MNDFREDKHLLHLLLHIGKLLNDELEVGLREYGIHGGQARILIVLHKNGPLTQVLIGRDLQIKSATVTNMAKRMEKSGLIYRQRDEGDNRVVVVSLTEKGRAAALFSMEVVDKVESRIRKVIQKEMIEMMRDPMEKLVCLMGGTRPQLH